MTLLLALFVFECQAILSRSNEFELNKIIPNNKIEVFIRADARVIFNDVAVLMSSLQKFKPNSINFLTNPQDD